MKKREEPHILDLEDVVYDLEALIVILDGLGALSQEGGRHVNLHKSFFMIGKLIGENAAIVENVMNHELERLRASKED